jgi:3'-phosphoadenosine 5'-phosphosulfate sulfotransferase (PAPS reductase)/FAD synthetase
MLYGRFQGEDMIMLHLLRQRRPGIPVLLLYTVYYFPETSAYRERMIQAWRLNTKNSIDER